MSNKSIGTQAKSRQSWFNPRGTIKNVHASLNVWIPQSKYATPECFLAHWIRFWASVLCTVIRSSDLQEASGRAKVILPAMKLNCFTNHSTSYIIKNSTGELFTYTPSGKVRTSVELRQIQIFQTSLICMTLSQRVMVSAVKSPEHLGTKQLVELLFSSQAIGHCKSTPTMEHGFLVQVKHEI